MPATTPLVLTNKFQSHVFVIHNTHCRYAYPVSYVSHTKDAAGVVTEVVVEADLAPAGKKPPKGVMNWVAQPAPGQEPLKIEVSTVVTACVCCCCVCD